MARQIGGGDNVMGSKEAIVNVSFKDDLGNILENASKLKEILDAVNSNFIAINAAVGMTTNSMGRLSSQTQKLVATTQQLRNEYQSIADASQRIGISQSIGASNGPFQDTDVVREALGGTGRASGLILPGGEESSALGRTLGIKDFVSPTYPKIRGQRSYANRLPGSKTRSAMNWQTSKKRLDSQIRTANKHLEEAEASGDEETIAYARARVEKLKGDRDNLKLSNPKTRKSETSWKNDRAYIPKDENPAGIGIASQVWEDYQSGASVKSITRGLLSSFDSPILRVIGKAFPHMTAAIGAGAAAYKAMDYLVKGATRYSGLTGGTGVFDNTGYAEGSTSFLGLQTRAWTEGLFNMAVGPGGFQQIQEALLGAGLTARDDRQYNKLGIRGLRYEGARANLQKMYEMGLQDVDVNTQLMQLTVERSNGSLATLQGTLRNLADTALVTNGNFQLMYKTLAAVMASAVGGLNMQGASPMFLAGTSAAAYSTAQNTLLKNGAPLDYNNIITRMLLTTTPNFQANGVNMNNLYYMMANNEAWKTPGGVGYNTALASDQAVDKLLGPIKAKLRPGASVQEAKDLLGQNSGFVTTAMQSQLSAALISDPNIRNNADAWIEWAAINMVGDPLSEQALADSTRNMARDAMFLSSWEKDKNGNLSKSKVGIDNPLNQIAYFGQVFGRRGWVGDASRGANETDYGFDEEERKNAPLGAGYWDYVRETGKSVGWVENILKNKDQSIGSKTYVKWGNKDPMKLIEFMAQSDTNPLYQQLLAGTAKDRLLVGTSEAGQKPSDIVFSDAGEMGGAGGPGGKVMDMTAEDLTTAMAGGVQKGLHDFNERHADHGLNVYHTN